MIDITYDNIHITLYHIIQLLCQVYTDFPQESSLKSPRTEPKCVFIDLGAADGNTFDSFLANGYGPVKNCPHRQWQAILVEARKRNDGKMGYMDDITVI